MPPTKFGPTGKKYDRMTKKTTLVYDYIKSKSQKDLFAAINNENSKPKLKAKCRNELNRRGVKIVYRPIESI